jgi:hypothetical protein
MKISTNSWHYRFLRFVAVYPEDSLCAYFRQLVFLLILAGLCLSVACVFVLAAAFAMDHALIVLFYSIIGEALGAHGTLMVAGVFGWVCLLGFWFVYFIETREIDININISVPKPPKDSLVYQYADSVHKKICPIIEFTDE